MSVPKDIEEVVELGASNTAIHTNDTGSFPDKVTLFIFNSGALAADVVLTLGTVESTVSVGAKSVIPIGPFLVSSAVLARTAASGVAVWWCVDL